VFPISAGDERRHFSRMGGRSCLGFRDDKTHPSHRGIRLLLVGARRDCSEPAPPPAWWHVRLLVLTEDDVLSVRD